MNNFTSQIETIKKERMEILELAKESILSNGEVAKNNLNDLYSTLNYDMQSVDKLDNLAKVQELIQNLSKEILNSKNSEEIARLRRKLNYYISKIKKELISRNVSEEEINKFVNNTNDFRKSISKYLRFERRNHNLVDIYNFYNNFDKLSLEEAELFSQTLKKEQAYNRRNLPKKEENIKPIIVKKKERIRNVESKPLQDLRRSSNHVVRADLSNLNLPKVNISYVNQRAFLDVDDYLITRINEFTNIYGVKKVNGYTDKFGKNIKTFIKNIPLYKKNKDVVKRMERELSVYYGPDLYGYKEYLKRHNSLREELKSIFNKSIILHNSKDALANHEYCVEWLKEFFDDHHMIVTYPKKVKELSNI